jgi:hypothetical protein
VALATELGIVSDMLGPTDRRRQSAGGPAESARMPPCGAGTTASAAPPQRQFLFPTVGGQSMHSGWFYKDARFATG